MEGGECLDCSVRTKLSPMNTEWMCDACWESAIAVIVDLSEQVDRFWSVKPKKGGDNDAQ
jgi:hypothetical protein